MAARTDMLRASALAGFAIEHAMLGAAHSMANPLTRHHGIPHGLAVGLLLPHVVRYNAVDPAARATYADLARASGLDGEGEEALARALADHLAEVLAHTALPASLADHGIDTDAVEQLALESAEQWTASFNPRQVDASEFAELLRAAL
jgi:alcohol dehydrogenase